MAWNKELTLISLELQKEKYCHAQAIACEESADKRELLTQGSDGHHEPLEASAYDSYYQPTPTFHLQVQCYYPKWHKDYTKMSKHRWNTPQRGPVRKLDPLKSSWSGQMTAYSKKMWILQGISVFCLWGRKFLWYLNILKSNGDLQKKQHQMKVLSWPFQTWLFTNPVSESKGLKRSHFPGNPFPQKYLPVQKCFSCHLPKDWKSRARGWEIVKVCVGYFQSFYDQKKETNPALQQGRFSSPWERFYKTFTQNCFPFLSQHCCLT